MLSYAEKIKMLDSMLQNLDTHFLEVAADQAKNAITSINDLKRALERNFLKYIASRIQKGFHRDALALVKNVPRLQSGTLEEIFKLAFGGKRDHLLKVIHFVNDALKECTTATNEMRMCTLQAVYNEMKFKNQNHEFAVLLLKNYATDILCKEKNNNYSQFEIVLSECETEIATEIAEIIKANGVLNILELHRYESAAIASLMQKIVRKVYSSNVETVPQLLRITKDFSINTRLNVFNELYDVMKELSHLESSAAFHLWCFVCENVTELTRTGLRFELPHQGVVDIGSKAKVMLQNTPKFCSIYCQLAEKRNFKTLNVWHNENDSLISALPIICDVSIKSNIVDARTLIAALKNLKENCHAVLGLETLHDIFVEKSLQKSFDFFELFYSVRDRIKNLESSHRKLEHTKLENLKQKAPECISALLWRNSSKGKIFNDFSRELLSCDDQGNRRVITSAPKSVSDEQLWSIEFDDSCLASLKNLSFDYGDGLFLHQAVGINAPCLLSGEMNNYVWRIQPTEGEYFKICSLTGNFLTADHPANEAGDITKVVNLKSEDDTRMQLWKFDH